MATRSFLRCARRLAGIAVVSIILTASPVPQPAVPLQASASALSAAPASADLGVIAYLQRSTGNIRFISPDGTGDRLVWTNPDTVNKEPPADLAWTRDGRELAFTGGHEQACSYYQSDVYTIRSNGTGYRRVTNAPACAELAALPQGSVTVNVTTLVGPAHVYVMGARTLIRAPTAGTVTFDSVADLGDGVPQPAVGIFGHYRISGAGPYADVLPGQTVEGGNVDIGNTGIAGFGARKVAWKGDGSTLAYGTGSCNALGYLSSNPPHGSLGGTLPVVAGADPCLVAFGPTTATADQYVYYSDIALNQDSGYGGIYLNSLGNAAGGAQLIYFGYWDNAVYDIEWLPDGSGFLFTEQYMLMDPVGSYSTIYRYDIASHDLTEVLTSRDWCARDLSISPDGQYVVFHTTADQYNDSTSSLRIVNIDGSGLHKLLDDAGRPAWGPTYTPDTTAPIVHCGTADGQWHANDVSITCTASDSNPGLANSADASFSLSTSVPTGNETANAATGTRNVCDRDGNCATAGPIGGNRVDKHAPSISISSPAAASYYLVNQPVAASYSCSDGGSSVDTCVGPVGNGSNIDTGSAEHKTFTVNSSDAVGNTRSQSVDYTVGYPVWLPAVLRP